MVFVLSVATALAALILAVTLYAITRGQDADLAMLAMTCRVGEGVVGASVPGSLALLWLATSAGVPAPDTTAALWLGALLLKIEAWKGLVSATLFAVGSTLFSYLFLRGRLIPVGLARLGVGASVLLAVGLPLQLTEVLAGAVPSLMWVPMLVFEVLLGLWLVTKGVAVRTVQPIGRGQLPRLVDIPRILITKVLQPSMTRSHQRSSTRAALAVEDASMTPRSPSRHASARAVCR